MRVGLGVGAGEDIAEAGGAQVDPDAAGARGVADVGTPRAPRVDNLPAIFGNSRANSAAVCRRWLSSVL